MCVIIATLGPTWEFQLCSKSCNLASWTTKWQDYALVRTSQVRTGHVRMGPVRTGPFRTGQGGTGKFGIG